MGLLDLKTDLKSLKYGNDQRGGGSSNQPYVVTPIPDGFADTSPDFLLRNGYLNPLSSIQDVSRLTKLFLDTKSPNGLLFITKQQLLERQNPILANTDRIYSPLNTLAQAGVLSTGYHLNKQGLNPFTPGYYNGGRSGYFFSTLAGSNVDDGINGGENRLTLLYTSKVANESLGTFTINPFGVTGLSDQVNLISYQGGPNSILGFGKTNIRIQNPTRTVVPKERATVAFGSSQVDNVNYLTPSYSPTINWNYKPSFDVFSGFVGASGRFYLNRKLSSDNIYSDTSSLYTDNVLNLLNRDTSTVIPIGKEDNTFVKSQSTLKSEPGYLVPNNINTKGNISWVYNPSYNVNTNGQPGVSVKYTAELDLDEKKVYETFYTSNPSNLLNRTGLEGENAPDSIYPSSSIITRNSYYKTKDLNEVINPNKKLFQTASIKYGTSSSLDELSKNLNQNQNIPDVYKVPKDIVKGLKENRTTTLSSLNPQYFTLNKDNGTVTSLKSIPEIETFNREDKYKTSITTWNNKDHRSKGVNNLDLTIYSDGQNITNISQGLRDNQTEQVNSDLIKFFFEINNNDGATNTQNWFLFFRAYLNDLGDNFKADWQSYKYVGRAENFYKYSGFSRDISLSFTVYAHSRAEMIPIYDKLNYLVGTTAPSYSNGGYMRGNFIYLTVGDYLNNVPGIIQSIDLKPSFDAGWDINRDENGNIIDSTNTSIYVGQLPKMIEINMSFTPIHSFTPQFGEAFIRNTVSPPKPTISIQQPTQDGVA